MGTKGIEGSRAYNYWPSSQFLSLEIKVNLLFFVIVLQGNTINCKVVDVMI
jgi:hypothetical protein